jgi:ArsR family transcriptional regulator
MKKREQSTCGNEPVREAGSWRLLELKVAGLQTLCHPARLMILEVLRHGERCVCDFGPILGLRQSNISQHLSLLRAANLVACRRDGKRVMYRIINPTVLEIIDLMGDVVRRQGEEIAEAVAQPSASDPG